MISAKTTVCNPLGLHMRPAQTFVRGVAPFQAEVSVRAGDVVINAKSIMMLMAACIKCGTEIEISCDGPDEAAALQAAVSLIESGLGE